MTTTAPVVVRAPLVAQHREGAYRRLRLAAPDIAAAAVPGQFLSIGIDAPGTLLRRPFAIAGADAAEGWVEIAIAAVGQGSSWLATQPRGTGIDVVGPLGRGFTPPTAPHRCILVGGGYGVAALGWLAVRLLADGHRVELVSGAATVDALFPPPDAPALVVTEITEDGSRGGRGLVTDPLADRLAGGRDGAADDGRPAWWVAACGPMPMLGAVARLTGAHGVPCQVSVEERMACTVGVCMTCVVPTRTGYQRACIEGPVLDAEVVRWDAVAERHA